MKMNSEYLIKQLVNEYKPIEKNYKFVTGKRVMEKLNDRIQQIVY